MRAQNAAGMAALALRAGVGAATAGAAIWQLWSQRHQTPQQNVQRCHLQRSHLHLAVVRGDRNRAEELLAMCPLAASLWDQHGCLPLHLACLHGHAPPSYPAVPIARLQVL
ncbi:hypothetical protein ABPG75_008481 [Micractinium tetrahymenae]